MPQFPLIGFSILFCLICYIICLKDRMIIQVLGKWMSPLLILSLLWMIFTGIIYAPSVSPALLSPACTFSEGFLIGYQTMDLFAAFFFSSFIFVQIQKNMPAHATVKQIMLAALAPSVFGVFLLAVMYLGLVFLGAYYAPIIQNISPELMLPTIAAYAIGNAGAFAIAVAILFSCLTTAVALNNIYARYLCTFFNLDSHAFPFLLLVTTVISFFISLLNFSGIARFLAPALELAYPSIIVLTAMSIFIKGHKNLKTFAFYAMLGIMLYSKYGK